MMTFPPQRAFGTLLIPLVLMFVGARARAEDWRTLDGKSYQGVTVLKTEPDAVTILYKDGGALVPLARLPADLQKRFHYDPLKAQAAADARAKADAENAKALAAETAQGDKMKAARDAKDKAEQKAIADRKRMEEAQDHNHMPPEPGVLESDKKVDGGTFNPPK
jgi:hypothetical protein